jgi:hypothetical protein
MSSTLTLSNGQQIWMDIVTGEVIESSVTPVTSIHQAAPTVVSDGRKTTVVAGQIHSQTTQVGSLWLRTSDGAERSFDLMNNLVSARSGHRLSVVWGASVGHGEGPYFGTRNHTTASSKVNLFDAMGRSKNWRLDVGATLSFFSTLVGCMLLGAFIMFVKRDGAGVDSAVIGALLGFGAWFLLTPVWYKAFVVRRAERLVAEIEAFAHEMLAARDAADVVPTDKQVDNRPSSRSSGVSAKTWFYAAVAAVVLGVAGWQFFRPSVPEQVDWTRKSPASTTTKMPLQTQGGHKLVQPPRVDAALNMQQLRRHEELMARAPSSAELESLPHALRPAGYSIAALYTLFPKGHEKPFPAVVEMLHARGAIQEGSPLTAVQLGNILQGLDAPSSLRKPGTSDEVAQALESGRSVFVPNGADLLRLTTVTRDASGQLTGFMVYDPAGRITSPASLSALEPLWSSEGVVVSTAKTAF